MTGQIGTLEELGVKPGDVVEWVGADPRFGQMTVARAETLKTGIYAGEVSATLTGYGNGIFGNSCKFRIISRATPPVDLTKLTAPFGLLDEVYGPGTAVVDGTDQNPRGLPIQSTTSFQPRSARP